MIGMSNGIIWINRVNTMTPRQNDLVVKNDFPLKCLQLGS